MSSAASDPTVASEVELLVPAVAEALWMWDTLGLELGEAAAVTAGHADSGIAAVVAQWYGAHPVIVVTERPELAPAGAVAISSDDPKRALGALAARFGSRPGVAVAELSGRADLVDVVLEAVPPLARVMFAGGLRQRLTIDFYVNVHRKGLVLHSSALDRSRVSDGTAAAAGLIARAARLLARADRADACRSACAVR